MNVLQTIHYSEGLLNIFYSAEQSHLKHLPQNRCKYGLYTFPCCNQKCWLKLSIYLSGIAKWCLGLSKITWLWPKSGQNAPCLILIGPSCAPKQPKSPNCWDGGERERGGQEKKAAFALLVFTLATLETNERKTTWNKTFYCGHVFTNPLRYTGKKGQPYAKGTLPSAETIQM